MDPNDELMLFPQPNTVNSGDKVLPISNPCYFSFFINLFMKRRDYITEMLKTYRSLIFQDSDCSSNEQFIHYRKPAEGERGLIIQIMTLNYEYPSIDDNESYTLSIDQDLIKLNSVSWH